MSATTPTTVDLSALSPLLDALADAIAARIGDKLTPPSENTATPWLNPEAAAAYLGDAPTSRIYDLVQQRKLTPHRDGRRLLLRRDDLDAYLEGER